MLRRILRTVAEFGVSDLHLINSARVEKSFWQSPLLADDKVEEAQAEAKQKAVPFTQEQRDTNLSRGRNLKRTKKRGHPKKM